MDTEPGRGGEPAMTLATNVYVLDQIEPTEVFRFCQELLEKYDEQGRGPGQQKWSAKQRSTWRDGESFVEPGNPWWIANDIGQGLPAILHIDYRPGVPLRTPEQAAECEDDCEPDCDRDHYYRACWLDVDFDTAYSARFRGGMGCGDLHAALVSALGLWLDARGVRWEWRNEFTGDVHGGDDRYERLIDLCSGGFEATAWFRTTVMPAIAARVLLDAPAVAYDPEDPNRPGGGA